MSWHHCTVQCHYAHIPIQQSQAKEGFKSKLSFSISPPSPANFIERQVFKLNTENIKVLAKSDLPIEPRSQPVLPTCVSPSSSTSQPVPSQHTSPDEAFTSFNVTDKGISTIKSENQDLMDIDHLVSSPEEEASTSTHSNKHSNTEVRTRAMQKE